MRPAFLRRIRRAKTASKDAAFFKKETAQEPRFFGGTVESFFSPATPAIQRKCEGCTEEEKIHTDAEAARSAQSMHAQAYTVGTDIVFAEGRYSPETDEGKKLLAHELTHVLQQSGDEKISRKEDEPEVCGANLDIEGHTAATFSKGAGKTVGQKRTKNHPCEDCPDDCVTMTGSLRAPYTVSTSVTLPDVPGHLTPCQKSRVKIGIKNIIAPHERKHVAAFITFSGAPNLPIDYKGCDAGYRTYLEGLAQAEYDRREAAANLKSSKLDPLVANVDLCCTDEPKKGNK